MIDHLNRQKYTCETMEDSYILTLDKDETNRIILNQGQEQKAFEDRMTFLRDLNLFNVNTSF